MITAGMRTRHIRHKISQLGCETRRNLRRTRGRGRRRFGNGRQPGNARSMDGPCSSMLKVMHNRDRDIRIDVVARPPDVRLGYGQLSLHADHPVSRPRRKIPGDHGAPLIGRAAPECAGSPPQAFGVRCDLKSPVWRTDKEPNQARSSQAAGPPG
jgi:hypothetical protein